MSVMLITVNICYPSGMYMTVNSVWRSDEYSYDENLNYFKIDEETDGIFDYIEISECKTSVTKVEIPSPRQGRKIFGFKRRFSFFSFKFV